jgi:hypothetical protein
MDSSGDWGRGVPNPLVGYATTTKFRLSFTLFRLIFGPNRWIFESSVLSSLKAQYKIYCIRKSPSRITVKSQVILQKHVIKIAAK